MQILRTKRKSKQNLINKVIKKLSTNKKHTSFMIHNSIITCKGIRNYKYVLTKKYSEPNKIKTIQLMCRSKIQNHRYILNGSKETLDFKRTYLISVNKINKEKIKIQFIV